MYSNLKFRFFALFTIFSLLLGALGIPTQQAHAAPAGTALQFNGSNEYVTFGNTRMTPGTLTGGPTWNTQANSRLGASSLTFNGTSQYVTMGAAPELGATNFTLEAWFYWTGGGGTTTTSNATGGGLTAGAIPLVTKGRGEADGSNVDLNYFLGIQGGKLAADFEEGVGGPGPLGQNHAIIGNTTITTNAWHHAAVTYDSVNAVWFLYLDGVQDGTLDIGSNIPPRADSIQHAAIGSALTSTGSAAGFFAGRIDEVRIWNIVRTQSEITASMNSEILVPTTGLLGRWGLNDAAASTTASNLNRLGVTSFTLEAWVKRDAGGVVMSTGTNGFDNAGGRPNIYPVVTRGMGEGETPANLNTNYFMGITSTGFVGADFEDTAGGGNHPAWGTTSIPVGEWHHIAATYTGLCWALYVDGISDPLNASATACPNATPESTSYQHPGLAAGLNSTGGLGAGYFAGTIDEARVWNRALSQGEIQTNKNLELTSGTGLLARWGINEGSGTSTVSSVGTFNGTLTNTPTWVSGFPMLDSDPPAAPTNLSATAGNASVSFTWTANGESDLAGYNLYRGTTIGGPYTKVNTPLITGTAYTDTGLTNSTPYFYVLRAVDSSNNESGNSNEASATPTASSTGLQFNGTNQYVTFGTASGLGAQNFTVETWFKRTGTGTGISTGSNGVTLIPLIAKGAPQADGTNVDENYVLGIRSSDGVLAGDFEIFAACDSRLAGDNNPIAGVTPIVTNTWYHAAFTYDGTALKLYLNGNLEATLPSTCIPRYDNSQPAALGTTLTTAPLAQGFFAGVLDEARIWNVARTQAEIMTTINQEISSGTGLIARWGMGEGSGSTINSSVGTFPGTLTNGPTWVTGAPFNIAPPPPPAAPTLLAATATAGLQIDLTWQDNSNNETGFKIERSPDGTEGWTEIATTSANVATYGNTGLNPGTFYCYSVRAYNATGDSDYSNISCATTPGEANNALNLGTGTAYVGFGDPAALDLSQFTIETWFKRTGAGTPNTTGNSGIPNAIPLVTHGAPESEGGTVDANWVLVIDDATDVIAADFEDMATGLNHPVLGTTPITDNVWHHAAATYDGTTWRLYLDGNLEATLLVNATPRSDSTQQSGLGAMFKTDGTALGHFDGALDEVRVWNYARSQTQIQGTINSAVTFPQTGLVARWGLNEPSGTTVSSNAGTSVNGSITGTGSAWVTGSASIVNHEPEFVSGTPADLTADISTPVTLTATVSDPDLDDLTVQFYGRSKAPAAPGPDFTIIALPDTQYYTGQLNGGTPAIFNSQTQWIVNNKTANNIVFVTQLGDCTEHGDNGGNPIEWQRADTAFQIIENPLTTGLTYGLPFGIAPGNHDQSPIGTPSGTTSYNAYFGEARFLGRDYYGGHYGTDNDNHYELFSASGMDFIIIHLEYDTSANAAVLTWADGLLKTHSTRRAIVVTHWMINGGSNASFSTQGQAIYTELKDNPNLFLLLGGHVPSPAEGSRTDTYLGNTVYSLMSDYQGRTNGGNGWLRSMTFSPANNTISVKTYSPWLSQFETDADSQFTLNYNMSSAPADFELIGTDTVPNGGTASVNWNGLDADAEYEWYVTINDTVATSTSDTRSFTTAASNQAPVVTEGASTNVTMSEDGSPTPFALTLHATDADAGDTLTWSLTTPASHGTASVSGIGASKVVSYTPTANYNGPDSFVVQVSDGNGGTDSITVNVTVQSVNDLPTANPQSVTTDKNVSKSITLTGSDLETAPASLTFNIDTPPAHGNLTGTAPNLTYTPTTNYSGSDSFTFIVNDGTSPSAPATVSITINATNAAPVLGAIGNKSVDEGLLLSFTATATDGDNNPLTYSLDSGNPAGSSISISGDFTWTPGELQGGSTYPITIRVTDGVLEDFETITVTVNEVNQNPQVTNPGAQVNAEGSVISLQINATDADLPANTLAYLASNLPTGLSISPTTGLISGTIDMGASASSPFTSSVTVSDGQGGSVPVNFNWSVLEAVPPPSGLTCSIIQPKPVTTSTGEKPQSKVWQYGDNWYAVFPTTASGASSAGTWLWKLQGTAWTEVLKLSDRTDVKADAKVVNNVVHVLLYAGSNTQLVSAEYSGGTYQLWTSRPTASPLSLTGSEIATIELDSTGRLWLTTENDATDQIVAYYSDSPYSSWSSPVVIASGVADDDISTIVAMPNNKIGIFWSNQNTQRFGFKIHNDADIASVWSADEVPASQSALNIGLGMGDDHLNLKVASDGTIYAGVKTSYDTAGYPKISLLVRRPAGTWDNLYNVDETGTRGIIMLDETNGYLTYIYTSSENYNPIVYKQSNLQTINFGSRTTLRSGSFNDASSMKENYNGEFVVLYSSSTEVAGQLCAATPASGAELSITKTDAKTTVRPSQTSTYIITVTNNGPQAVTGATVTDSLPSALTNASWVCTASGGAGCAASGSGNINDTVNLPVNGSVTYTLSAEVASNAQGSVVNTAAVALPGGTSDPILSNNTATDTDTIIENATACETDPTLVGCWQMEENGGNTLLDGSSFLNDAALSGTPAWAAGKVGSNAFDFDGTTAYATVPDDASLDLTNQITVAAWIRPETVATQDLIKKAVNGGTDGYELSLATSTSTWPQKVFFRINQVTNGDTYRVNSTTLYPIDGTWMHVAATFDGANLKLYINGQLEATTPAAGQSISVNNLSLSLGGQSDGQRKFTGGMDEARVYNRVLTLGEIKFLAGIAPLTVSKTGTGSGSVTSVPAGIDCGATCSFNFAPNDLVTLTASPALGSTFTGWSGAGCTGTGTCQVTMNAAKAVTANFDIAEYTLTINKVGNGTVTKSPDQATYHYGDVVDLTATADAGWSFGGWSANATGGSVTITANTTVTATFTQDEYTLTINKLGNGTVTKSPDQATYHSGDVVNLTATPDVGWSFTGWSPNVTGGSVTITTNTTVTATFTQDEYTLTVNKVGNGTVTKSPDQATYHSGDVINLTATPDADWSFAGWSANATGGSVTITGNTIVTATFTEKLTPTLSLSGGPFTYNGLPRSVTVNGSVAGTVSNIRYNGSTTLPINAGTYAVTADFTPTNTATYNSLVNAVAGSVTINKAVLTVTAHNISILAGSPDPAFTFGYSGFVNSETTSVLTTAPVCSVLGAHTAAGSYDILCSGGLDENYSFTYVKGTLTVTAANNPPTNIALSSNDIDENQPVGTLIGTFSTTDVDAGDTFAYSFCGGADDASFTISGNSLRSAVMFDYESRNSYSICVRSTDSGALSTQKTFTINVNNVMDTQTFADVPVSYWAWSYIERLYAAGVTGGCGVNPLIYCPDASVTRAQMAVFLLKGIHGSSYQPPAVGADTGFSDVGTDYWAAAWIKQLAAEGVTSGCGIGIYCPDQTVTRAQMAVFLLKAKYGASYLPPAATGVFTDVPVGYWADRWIEQLAVEGITGGCGAGTYCPDDNVTRAQMAVFLVKAFNIP